MSSKRFVVRGQAPTLQALARKPIVTAIWAALGMVCSVQAAADSRIVTDGRTATDVSLSGNTYNISTETISQNGRTGFNSFHDFSLDASDTVRMHLPNGADSLVNLVWDSQAVIDGRLDSLLSDGAVGGKVYFADPHGIVVGAGAVINVGALSLSAPTHGFMASLLDSDGNLSTDTTGGPLLDLMQGTETQGAAPSDGSCLICVEGAINANNAVRLRATAIDVSGTIFVAGNGSDMLSTAVNVEGQADPVIVSDGNTIRLIADSSTEVEFGDATAAASIDVSGTLRTASGNAPADADPESWGLVQASASAVARSAFASDGDTVPIVQAAQVGDLLKDQDELFEKGVAGAAVDANLALSDKAGQAAFVRASATASVDISGSIRASGDVKLSATTATEASTAATSERGEQGASVMVGAMYGAVYSKAGVNVSSGADVVAGGALVANAETDNTLDVSAGTVSGQQSVTTVAWSQAAVEASSVVAGNVSAQSLEITAHNANSFSTEASGKGKDTAVGVAAAVSLQTVRAEAMLGGTPAITTGGSGDVIVAAGNDTRLNRASATTYVLGAGSAQPGSDQTAATNANLSKTLANKTNSGLNADGSQDSDALPFHLGGAIAYTDASSTASASIADNVTFVTPGDVAVYSAVIEAGVHNGASSGMVSNADGVDVAAAVAFGNYVHDASATIGAGAHITAGHIGVGSDVLMPFDWGFGQSDNADAVLHMFDGFDDFIGGVEALGDMDSVGLDTILDGVTSYAGVAAGGESTAAAVGGSVNYLSVTNRNRAWVGNGANLTSTADAAATPGEDGWSTSVGWSDDPIDWAHSLTVAAHTDTTVFGLVGDISSWKDGGDKAALGGAFNYTGYNNHNVAGVGSGAILHSNNDIGIDAFSDDTLFALSPVSGSGGSLGMQGTVAITDVSDVTHASLSAAADVVARALQVEAENQLTVWSLAGALAMSEQLSLGVSVAINHTTTDTVASIGDNSADDPAVAAGATPAQSGGSVRVSELSVQAATHGESGALSVAGASSAPDGPDGGSGGSGGEKPGSKLTQMIKRVKSVTGDLQDAMATVDGLAGELGDDEDSLLGTSSEVLEDIAGGAEGVEGAAGDLEDLVDAASETGSDNGGTKPDADGKNQGGKFGIAVSGAAAVNLVELGARAELDGANIIGSGDDATVTVRATDDASLTSMAGAAALQRAKASSFSGAMAGAVAYSSVANTTTALVRDSQLSAVPHVTVQALDASQQLGVAIGMGINTSDSTSATIAGSVSLATSRNSTRAAIEGGSVLDGGGGSDSFLDVTAYDRSRIGVGAGSLYGNTSNSSSANLGIGFTYADISNTTSAALSGHSGAADAYDISGYHGLSLRALDSSQIAAGAVAGGYSGSQKGNSLAGAVVWTSIGNSTLADIDEGMRLQVDGSAYIQASAVAPVVDLDELLDTPDAVGYDFTGAGLGTPDALAGGQTPGSEDNPDQPTLSLDDSNIGTSIIAVAGTVQVGGNNLGLSYVGNNVHNTHSVRIDDAALDIGDTLSLTARDDTRIVGIAAGLGVSSGQFAGLGSATSNVVANTNSILIGSAATPGHGASIVAGVVDALASDDTSIYALAGNVAVGKGSVAAGGAITYNDIANSTVTHAGATLFDVDGMVALGADESSMIMAGAVAGTATKGTALALSFGWNQTSNSARAVLDDGGLVRASAVDLSASNSADIYALSGGVAIGGSAAVGLAVTVSDIGDTTSASIEDVGLDVAAGHGRDGSVKVTASGTGTQYSLAVAGAVGSNGAGVAGSVTTSMLSSDVTASVADVYGIDEDWGAATDEAALAGALSVQAQSSGSLYSLAGGVAFGSSVGVGAAVTVADVGGSTTASVSDAVFDVAGDVTVSADSDVLIESAAVAGAAANSVAISASNTTNLVHNTISASMTNVGTADDSGSAVDSDATTWVSATDRATINALSGAVGGAGSVAVGAATSVNRIATTTSATFDGGSDDRLYKTGSLLVTAGASNPDGGDGGSANINTIAVGASGGGSVAVAGSLAVNLLSGSTTAGIGQGAQVIADDNVGVLASSDQGINVLAGQAALGGSAGVGVGVVVNDIDGTTTAFIEDSDVTAYGNGAALGVDSGAAAHSDAIDDSIDITGSEERADSIADPTNYTDPDLSGAIASVHGVAVNASNQQHITTLGVGASVAGSAAVNALAGVNIVGGTTSARIEDSQINQADRVENEDGVFYDFASAAQQVDVRAGSRQYQANFVANLSASGTVAVNGSVATNIFNAGTSAEISGSTVSSRGDTAIEAVGQQWSLAVAAGAAASGMVGAAASGTVTMHTGHTSARLDGGSLDVGSLDVVASSHTASSQIAGAVGIGVGAAGIAGAAAVNVNSTATTASIENGAAVTADGEVNVNAVSRNEARALVVGGGIGLYAGVAGGALVTIADNSTHAFVEDSTVRAADIDIAAADTQIVDAYSGTLGGGLVGIGGSVNLSLLQSSVGAGAIDSTLTALGDENHDGSISITADMERDLSSAAVAFGAGAVGVGLSASVIIAGTGDLGDNGDNLNADGQVNLDNLASLSSQSRLEADNADYGLSDDQLSDGELAAINDDARYSLDDATGSSNSNFGGSDGVRATVSGGNLSATGQVTVGADVQTASDNIAGGGAVGVAAVGGSLAYTALSTDVEASIDDSVTVTAGSGIDVHATAGNLNGNAAASTEAYAGVGGLVGVGAAVAVSHVDNTISASVAGSLQAMQAGSGALTVTAADSSSSVAGNENLSGINLGGIIAGAVVVDAQRSSSVSALLHSETLASGFADVNIGASSSGLIRADAVMGAGGVLTAINGVVATAGDSTEVVAGIGDGAEVSAAATAVQASADSEVSANALGITIGGIGAGIGASVATASVSATVDAFVGDGAVFAEGDLSVAASASPVVEATSSGGAGGVLMGANASVANAENRLAVRARVGNHVTLPSGDVSISATSDTRQSASATGVSVGLVSVGASVARATSAATTTATLGDGDGTEAATAGSLAVIARGTDVNNAWSMAGSGGLFSGNASEALTSSTSSATASIGSNLNLAALSGLQLSATEKVSYGGTADSLLAAAVGGSGAHVNNVIDVTTDAHIGDGTRILAGGDIDVLAQTTLGNSAQNGGATGGGGGVVTGTAALVETNLTVHNTAAIGEGVELVSGLYPSGGRVGHTAILAGTLSSALSETATISTGGVVPKANAEVDIIGNFVNDVSLGDGGTFFSFGRTDIATYTSLNQVSALATANSYGLAPIGASAANVTLGSIQTVDIGSNVDITGYDEIDIVAGRDILNSRETVLGASAVAQTYARGFIAIPDAEASATTSSASHLALGSDSTVTGGGDVAIGAVKGTSPVSVDGTGYGYQLGFIPAVSRSSHQSSTGVATTRLDGDVTAGAFNTINLSIDADGNLDDSGTSAPYRFILDQNLNPTEYLNLLDGTVGKTYSGIDNAAVGAFIFDPMFVGAGNVYLYGSDIDGSGAVNANGAPSVTIENASAHYVFLPGIETSFGSGGRVLLSGGASDFGGLTVTETDSNAVPTVTINSTYPAMPDGATPGIVLGDVVNIGGSLNITNLAGSLLLRGTVHANAQYVDAANGYVVVQPNESGIWFSGADPSTNLSSSWISEFLQGIVASPDYAAGAIANFLYPGASSSPYLPDVPDDYEAKVLVLYGSCAPYAAETGRDGCGGTGPSGNSYSLLGRPLPLAPSVALESSGKFTGNELSSTSAFTGEKFIVEAKYINIDGAINAGTPATWSMQTTDALKSWIESIDEAYANGAISNPNISLTVNNNGRGAASLTDSDGNALLELTGDQASQLVGAVYNAATQQLILDNVNASGGGSVSLEGRIVSTARGSINVNSGFGAVTVNNTTGVPLAVQNVYSGNGGLGIITIKDDLQTWVDGTAKVTWYVSEDGQPALQYDNSNGATDWSTANLVGAVGTDTTYDPKAGVQFKWSATAGVQRPWADGAAGEWAWTDAGADGTAGHWTFGSMQFIDGNGSPGYESLDGDDYKLSISGEFTDGRYRNVAYHGCDNNGHCHFGTNESGTDSAGNPASLWQYYYPTEGYVTVETRQRADLPIGINFTTSASNSVDIHSNSDILLGGQITNTGGATTLAASEGGSIVQAADNALLWTRSLTLSSLGGDIGSGNAPLQVRIAHDGNPGSDLIASTDGGDIDIDVDSGSYAQAFQALAAGSAGYGDVTVRGTGSLVGIAGSSVDVIGRDVNLSSAQGSVGGIDTPLVIETHPDALYNGAIDGGVLNVHAYGDIGIDNRNGDIWVGRVVSEIGDVALTAPNGGIYDARELDATATLSEDQAKAIWDKLHLSDGAAVQNMVAAVEHTVDASYAEYWQLLGVGTVVDGHFTLGAEALALYWPLAAAEAGKDPSGPIDPAATQEYASKRYDRVVGDFESYIGSDWATTSAFDGRDPDFAFALDPNSEVFANLTQNSTWTDSQLKYAIDVAALVEADGGRVVGTAEPNISGGNITLNAGSGGVGRNELPLTIDYQDLKNLYAGQSDALTDAEILALGLTGAPGDVQLFDAAGNLLLPDDPDLQSKLATLSIKQTSPLYIAATGRVDGSATGSLYLAAGGDLAIGQLQSGSDMRLTASGSIHAAAPGDAETVAITAGGDLQLSAENGHISLGNGSAADPGGALAIDIGGTLLSATAATDVQLHQVDGDLVIGTVFANGLASLEASQGSLLGLSDGVSVSGNDIRLAAGDDIGRRVNVGNGVDSSLRVQMGSDGQLDATAGGAINLDTPQGDFHIGSIQSGGNLVLTAAFGALDAESLASTGGAVQVSASGDTQFGEVHAAGDVTLAATDALTAGAVTSTTGDVSLFAVSGMDLHTLEASGGSITARLAGAERPAIQIGEGGSVFAADFVDLQTGGDLLMGRDSLIRAAGPVTVDVGGDLVLGRIDGLAATGTAIDLRAGGAITGNGDGLNLQARAGGSTLLRAGGDIGSLSHALQVDVDHLDVASDQGGIWIHALGDVDISQLIADNGATQLSVDGGLRYDLLRAGLGAAISALHIDGDLLTVGGTASVRSVGNSLLNTSGIGGDLEVDAGGDLIADTMTVGGSTILQSGGALTLATLGGADGATLAAGGTMTLGDLELMAGDLQADADADLILTGRADVRQGDAVLTSKAAMALAALDVAGALNAGAGTDLSVDSLDVGGGAHIGAGSSVSIRSGAIGGDLDTVAGGDLIANTLTVGGSTLLQSGGALTLATLSGADGATLNAGGTMTLGDLELAAGDLQAAADADLILTGRADVLEGDTTLQASGSMHLDGPIHGGRDITMAAGGPLRFTTLDAQGDVFGQSLGAEVSGTGVSAGNALRFLAASDIRIEELLAGTDIALEAGAGVDTNEVTSGRDVAVIAGGDVAMNATQAAGTVSVDAGGGLAVGNMQAGRTLDLAAQRIRFDTLVAPNRIRALARTGDVIGAELRTRDADIAAQGEILLDAAAIGERINLAANTIEADIRHSGGGQTLYSVLSGFEGATAERITVGVDGAEHWTIDRLAAVDAGLVTTASSTNIQDGRIEQTMRLRTADAELWMEQSSAALEEVHVQLSQPGLDFRLYQSGKHTLSDAYVVRYDYGYQVETPDYLVGREWRTPYYQGESALRFNGRLLAADSDQDDTDEHGAGTPAANAQGDGPLAQSDRDRAEIAVNVRDSF